MEKYESISVVGEGSYGVVMKCRHKATGHIVAIKKFIETEEDHNVRKMALREIRLLKKLRHDNLVNMIEVFRKKRRFYLVFEYMDHTLLDELEDNPGGLGDQKTRQHMFQVIRGIDFCHNNNILHRDIKPENILVSEDGVIKLCDFGFARFISDGSESYTDYVATRWYRAPELLVGDTKYGREVDIWAIGCLFSELMSGDPIFPGESDIDQLYQIIKLQGKLCPKHEQMLARNPLLKGMKKPVVNTSEDINYGTSRSLYKLFPTWPNLCLEIVSSCLRLDPSRRPTSGQLLQHPYFTHDNFIDVFLPEIRQKIEEKFLTNPLIDKQFLYSDSCLEKKGMMSSRRNSQMEARWRINFGENNNVGEHQKSFVGDVDNCGLLARRSTLDCNSPMDITEDGESLENNNKFGSLNKYSPLFTGGKVTSFPCKMTIGSCDTQPNSMSNLSPPTPTSPLPFQSLQVQGTTDHLALPTPTGLLHPSINNLNFTHSIRSSESKNNKQRSIVPPRGLPRTQPGRKLDRYLPIEVYPEAHSKPPWKLKCTHDDFSLPNLPGASSSPAKGIKKKLNPSNTQNDNFISPAVLHANPSKMRYWIRPPK